MGDNTIADHDDSFQPSGGKTAGPKPAANVADPIESMKQGTVLYNVAALKLTITEKVGQ